MSPAMTLTTSTTHTDGRATVLLEGELDISSAPILVEDVSQVLADGPSEVVLDLRDLTFLDSSGLRAFFDLRDRAAESGATITATGARGMVRRALDTTGVQLNDV